MRLQPEAVLPTSGLCGGKVYYDLLEKRRDLAVTILLLFVLNSYIRSLKKID
jgi:hypothetical protein